MLSKVWAAVAAFAKKNPAVVSWALTMAVTLAAHFGFHLSAGAMTALVAVVGTVLHTYVHVATRKAAKPS